MYHVLKKTMLDGTIMVVPDLTFFSISVLFRIRKKTEFPGPAPDGNEYGISGQIRNIGAANAAGFSARTGFSS